MRVLIYAKSPCIRTYKEARGLKQNGVTTILAYTGKALPSRYPGLSVEEAFDEIVPIGSVYMPHFVEDRQISILHTAHPPDNSVRDLMGCGIPTVHDFHDLDSLLINDPLKLRYEGDAARFASGLVYVGSTMAEYVAEKYPNRAFMETYVMNAADDPDIPCKAARPWPRDEVHVTYAAAMPRWNEGHFRDIQKWTHQITAQGIHLHIHALIVKPELTSEANSNPYFHIEPIQTGQKLLASISRYDAGIIPHRGKDEGSRVHVNMSVPNKIFEYWQAGIPVIALTATETNRLIKSYAIGWRVKNFEGLRKVLSQNYYPTRNVITMREETQKLINLYEMLL